MPAATRTAPVSAFTPVIANVPGPSFTRSTAPQRRALKTVVVAADDDTVSVVASLIVTPPLDPSPERFTSVWSPDTRRMPERSVFTHTVSGTVMPAP